MRLALFAALTTLLAWVSRAALANPRSHGFPRFFGWICVVALMLLNFVSLRQWFSDPFTPHQIASWILLSGSAVEVVLGGQRLVRHGQIDARREDPALFAVEKTTRLVTHGVYGYVRHPIYGSLVLLAWGVFFKRPSWFGAALTAAATAFFTATARVEEGENERYFGSEYAAYRQRTRMFIPFVL